MGWNIRPPKISKLVSKNFIVEEEIKKMAFNMDKEITVVSFFGPSQFASSPCGIGLKIGFQLAVDTFGTIKLLSNDTVDAGKFNEGFTTINGFYNEEEGVVILCLDGAYDPNVCLQSFKASPGIRFMSLWAELKCSYSRSLLFLFSVSHLMVLCNVGPYFDTSYIGVFQSLDRLRRDMLPHLREMLDAIPGLPEAWANQCRICSPRLLMFVPVDISEKPLQSLEGLKRNKDSPAFMKFRKTLENEVYQIFRKCRIITNNSGHSLFALPMDQEADYVFLYDDTAEYQDDLTLYIEKFCDASNERVLSGVSPRLHTEQPVPSHKYRDNVRKFRNFLLSHINVAKNGGFDDNAYRPGAEDRKFTFILPKFGDWINVFNKLSDLLVGDQLSGDEYSNQALRKFSESDIDLEYLENQCSNNFHKVFSVYTKNIPSYYSFEEQTKRVNSAIDAFLKISSAPGIVPWLEKLTEKCDRFWKRGRQQCATLSLHRKSCVNPCHQIQPGDHLEVLAPVIPDENLPKMTHSAGNRFTSYCNCGRRSGYRDDPFTIREANFDFYERLALDCCYKLESYKFPVFEDSLGDQQGEGLTLEEMLRILIEKKKQPSHLHEDFEDRPISLERDLRQDENEDDEVDIEYQEDRDDFVANPVEDGGGDERPGKRTNETDVQKIEEGISGLGLGHLSQEEIPLSLPKLPPPPPQEVVVAPTPPPPTNPLDVATNLEFLPGMLHSQCPDLLPLFSSWSLVRFGPASAYAHTNGILYQPDFLVGANYLLPYDVSVKAPPGVAKPVPRRIQGKVPGRGVKKFEEFFNVKIFIGFEYECKKGHRFILESPDKVLNMSNPNFGPNIREAAAKVASSEMPLYHKCPCNTHSTGEQLFAQLMRVHVVTPKAPVFVQLTPRVQPSVNSPFFFPQKEIIKLTPSNYWMLRFPFSYVSEEQIFSPPTLDGSYRGRICKGLFSVTPMSQLETLEWEAKSNQYQ